MDFLFIGGTRFVGLAMVEIAARRGHSITLVHRGNTPLPQRLAQFVTEVICDRSEVAEHIPSTKKFSAIIDTSGYLPHQVAKSAKLADRHSAVYCYISTVSVYPEACEHRIESAEIGSGTTDLTITEFNAETYGPLKLGCETILREATKDQALIIRPTIVTGPHDYTDRFSTWVLKLAGRTGQTKMLMPEGRGLVQFIDADDLATFTLNSIEGDLRGIYNAAGPSSAYKFGQMIEDLSTPASPRFVSISEDEMDEYGVRPWVDLPMWVKEADRGHNFTASTTKAIANGMQYTNLRTTATKILDYRDNLGDYSLATGIHPDREAEIISAMGK